MILIDTIGLKDFLNKNNKEFISVEDFSTFTDEQKALIDG